jgi:hypothetical protein
MQFFLPFAFGKHLTLTIQIFLRRRQDAPNIKPSSPSLEKINSISHTVEQTELTLEESSAASAKADC